MKIGLDQWTLHHLTEMPARETLDLLRSNELQGMQFLSLHNLSPSLDRGELAEIRQHADEQDMYIEVGVPRVNPHGRTEYRTGTGSETEELRVGLRHHLELIASTTLGSRAVRCFLGGPGDRLGNSVPWPQQISDTIDFLTDFIPVLRDLDLKLAFENHADTTTSEILGIIDRLGPGVAGFCLDTGNFVITLEDPLEAVRRAAPYTIATHFKDGIVVWADDGIAFNARPIGEGILPIGEIVRNLAEHNPDLMLSIEDHEGLFAIPMFTDDYIQTFPQLSAPELAHVVRLTANCEAQIAGGTLVSPAEIESVPWEERALPRIERGVKFLRPLVAGDVDVD